MLVRRGTTPDEFSQLGPARREKPGMRHTLTLPLAAAATLLAAIPALAQSAGLDPTGSLVQPTGAQADQPPPAASQPTRRDRREGSVFVLRAGTTAGSGTVSSVCDKGDCGPADSADYDSERSLVLGVDWLRNSSRSFRFGGGLTLLPSQTVNIEGNRFELGTSFGTDFVLEGLIDLSPTTTLTLRGNVGVSLLFPGKDLEDTASAQSDACANYQSATGESCQTDEGPYLGAQIGFGPGLIFDLGNVGLRVDAVAQGYAFRTLEMQVGGTESSVRFAGFRPMLLVGLEL